MNNLNPKQKNSEENFDQLDKEFKAISLENEKNKLNNNQESKGLTMEIEEDSVNNTQNNIQNTKETKANISISSNSFNNNENNSNNIKLPKFLNTTCLIILGMAGSGKTTFIERLELALNDKNKEDYIINLDPAVKDTLYEANLDIRDTIKYKEVMKKNGLGPNGAIMTCLNIFSTNVYKILEILEKKQIEKKEEKSNLDFLLVDTPGQLEVFSWSASGKLLSDSFAINYPTLLVYVVDIPRCEDANIFVSNMMYAISIMYKMKLPLIIVFNKKDVVNEKKVYEYIQNYEVLQKNLELRDDYINSFSMSLSLVLEEFYKTIKYCAVSSTTGEGMDTFLEICDNMVKNYVEEVKNME